VQKCTRWNVCTRKAKKLMSVVNGEVEGSGVPSVRGGGASCAKCDQTLSFRRHETKEKSQVRWTWPFQRQWRSTRIRPKRLSFPEKQTELLRAELNNSKHLKNK
jgi:hypothetical protein